MKNLILGIMAIMLLNCSNNKEKLVSSVSYINYDTLVNTFEIKDNMKIDSLYSLYKIGHSSIIIDSTKFYIAEGFTATSLQQEAIADLNAWRF